jgi:hypothetical protein
VFLISRIKGWFRGRRPTGDLRGTDNCSRCGQAMNKRMEGNMVILSCLRYADHRTICVLRPVPWPGEVASDN